MIQTVMSKRHVVPIRLNGDLFRQLSTLARKSGLSVATLAEGFVVNGLLLFAMRHPRRRR